MDEGRTHWSYQPAPYQVLAVTAGVAGGWLYGQTREEMFVLGGFSIFAIIGSYSMHLAGEHIGKILAGLGVVFSGMSTLHEFFASPRWPTAPDVANGAVAAIKGPVDGVVHYASQWEKIWHLSQWWIGMPSLLYVLILAAREWIRD